MTFYSCQKPGDTFVLSLFLSKESHFLVGSGMQHQGRYATLRECCTVHMCAGQVAGWYTVVYT